MTKNTSVEFYMPALTLIGAGMHREIPERLKKLGVRHPLLVTDKGMTALGVAGRIVDLTREAGLQCTAFDDIVPNPTDANVEAGLAVYRQNGCDGIVTLGGGSAHDAGKGIGLLATNGGRIHDYEGVNRSSKAMPPFLAVNTTAGTASEMTRFCIITDTTRKVKMAIVDGNVTPTIAMDDPELMVGMPAGLTAATGMDALTHAVEAYVSINATPMTDACAEKAIKLIAKYLRRAVGNGHNLEAREAMCHAQYLAGMAFNNAGLGGVHAMAHQLGGVFDLPHGECNAILLPHLCRFNMVSSMERFAAMAEWFGVANTARTQREAALAAIDSINALIQDVGIPGTIDDLAKRYNKTADAGQIPTMAENAMHDACCATNPRTLSIADITELYKGIFR